MSWNNDPNTPDDQQPSGTTPPPPPPAPGGGSMPPPPAPGSATPPPSAPGFGGAGAQQPPVPGSYGSSIPAAPAGAHGAMPPGQPGALSVGDAFGAAWNVFKANFGTFAGLGAIQLVGIFVYVVSLVAVVSSAPETSSTTGMAPTSAEAAEQANVFAAIFSSIFMFGGFLLGVVAFVATCALTKAAHVALETGKVSFGQAFSDINWLGAFAVNIAVSIASGLITAVTLGIGSLVTPVLFMFALPAVIAGESIGDSLSTMTRLVTKNAGSSFALLYLGAVCVAVVSMACFIPAFLVGIPLMIIAVTYGYRVLTGKPVAV